MLSPVSDWYSHMTLWLLIPLSYNNKSILQVYLCSDSGFRENFIKQQFIHPSRSLCSVCKYSIHTQIQLRSTGFGFGLYISNMEPNLTTSLCLKLHTVTMSGCCSARTILSTFQANCHTFKFLSMIRQTDAIS